MAFTGSRRQVDVLFSNCCMVAVAQLVERRIVIPVAEGSNPSSHPTLYR